MAIKYGLRVGYCAPFLWLQKPSVLSIVAFSCSLIFAGDVLGEWRFFLLRVGFCLKEPHSSMCVCRDGLDHEKK